MSATLALAFASRLEHISLAGAAVRAMCEVRGIEADSATAIELVTVEIATNVVEHGYAGRADQPVRIEVSFYDDRVEVVVRDRGATLPAERIATATLPTISVGSAEDLPEGGFGLALVRMLVDRVSLDTIDGWNVLHFVRNITRPQPPETNSP